MLSGFKVRPSIKSNMLKTPRVRQHPGQCCSPENTLSHDARNWFQTTLGHFGNIHEKRSGEKETFGKKVPIT